MKNDLISIIIPTYNRANNLDIAIKSVLEQNYSNWELIIIDDNNNNSNQRIETEKIIDKYKKIIKNNFIYIKHSENKGAQISRNEGIFYAKGNFLAFLDDDDYYLKDFLEKLLVEFNNSDNNIGVVYCNSIIKINNNYYKIKKEEKNYSGDIFKSLLSGWSPGSISLCLFKKECFSDIKFNERLKSFQDYDIFLQISKKFHFKYLNKYLVIRSLFHSEQISLNPIKRYNGFNYLISIWGKDFIENLTKKEYLYMKRKFLSEIYINYSLYYLKNNKRLFSLKFLLKYIKNKIVKIKVLISLLLSIIFNEKIYYNLFMLKFKFEFKKIDIS